jgi:gas vesicle protein
MESMNRQESGTLFAFMTGAVVGAGITLLFVPEARVEMRRLLSE